MVEPIRSATLAPGAGPAEETTAPANLETTELAGASPELVLLCLQNRAYAARCHAARSDVDTAARELTRLRELIREAREAAQRAREQSGLFGGIANVLGSDVAPILGAVGSAALIVATGGSATPLVLAAAGLALGARTAQALELDPKLCAALGVAAAGAGVMAGNGAAAGSSWGAVAGAAQAGSGAAAAGAGVCSGIAGHHAAEVLHAEARAEAHRSDERVSFDRQQAALLALGSAGDDLRRAIAVASAVQSERRAAAMELIGELS